MASSARFGGFSLPHFGASFLGGQTRAFLAFCFVAGVFFGANRLNLRYRHEARKPYLYDADDDFGFYENLFLQLDSALNLARFKTAQILINSEFL